MRMLSEEEIVPKELILMMKWEYSRQSLIRTEKDLAQSSENTYLKVL